MILVWLILIPFIGGLLSWQAERYSRGLPRWIALLTAAGVSSSSRAAAEKLPRSADLTKQSRWLREGMP